MPLLNSRLLDLRSGEWHTFIRAFGLLSFTLGGHTLVETARDALFLTRLPPQELAGVYVAIAVCTFLLTPLSALLVRVVGARNSMVTTLVVSAYGIAWFRLQPPTAVAVVGLYVFGALAATTLVAQFWMLASTLFTPAQGRRLFGPLAAGGVLGAVAGASVASLLLMRLPVTSLLVGAVAAFLFAALVATTLEVEADAPSAATRALLAPAEPTLETKKEARYVGRLAVIAATSLALQVVVDYLFKARVAASIPSAELATFFARYQLGINALSLVVQLLITGPLTARLGVLGIALLPPSLLLLGSGVAVLSGAQFLSIVMLKTLDAALRNSVQRVGLELLWAPLEGVRKAAAKSFVDGAVTRGAQASAALGLLVLTQRVGVSLVTLTWVAAACSLPWLIAVARVRKPYIDLFRRALQRGNIARELGLPTKIDLTAAEALIEALARPEALDVIAAIDLLAERGRDRLIPALILYHDDERVLERALSIFSASDRRDWIPLAERLLKHPSESVQLAAVRALALSSNREALEHASTHESPAVRATATLHLALLDGGSIRQDPRVLEVLQAPGEAGRLLRIALIEALAAHPTPDATQVLLQLGEDPSLQNAVTVALGRTADASAIPFAIERLSSRSDRLAARSVLVRIGPPAFDALLRCLADPSTPRRTLLHVPRTLAAFETPAAVSALLGVLGSSAEGIVRYKALRGLEQLARETALPISTREILVELARNAAEYLRLFALSWPLRRDPGRSRTSRSLVLGLMEDKLKQSMDRMARLVQVIQRADDVPSVFAALRSEDRRQRARATEFLDALVRTWERSSTETPQLLRLVVDDLPDEERIARAEPWVGPPPRSAEEALERMAEDTDMLVREIAREASRSPTQSRPRSHPPPAPPVQNGEFP